ncbi:hypothetical protein T4D_15612 [Trichinella pseudospiralis]|uniref:Uncharacterized protein n=1 Tax=Trichinella pseudospiralis TaxID=6337 RepID=A0A0V1FGH2_TRIPS|nr:hypothetical protein T4D_15612 [Trichinella pseudospiralis]
MVHFTTKSAATAAVHHSLSLSQIHFQDRHQAQHSSGNKHHLPMNGSVDQRQRMQEASTKQHGKIAERMRERASPRWINWTPTILTLTFHRPEDGIHDWPFKRIILDIISASSRFNCQLPESKWLISSQSHTPDSSSCYSSIQLDQLVYHRIAASKLTEKNFTKIFHQDKKPFQLNNYNVQWNATTTTTTTTAAAAAAAAITTILPPTVQDIP